MSQQDQPAELTPGGDTPNTPQAGGGTAPDYEELVRKVAERVLVLWREELRRERERRQPGNGR